MNIYGILYKDFKAGGQIAIKLMHGKPEHEEKMSQLSKSPVKSTKSRAVAKQKEEKNDAPLNLISVPQFKSLGKILAETSALEVKSKRGGKSQKTKPISIMKEDI